MTKQERCACGDCPACQMRAYKREWAARWRAANPEAAREKSRRSHERNREKERAGAQRYDKAHREERRIAAERRRLSDEGRASRAAANRYSDGHLEELRSKRRAYYEANRERVLAARAQRRVAEPEKEMARKLVSRAVATGRLVRGDCEIGIDCRGRIEAHHDDYDKPLDVRWLCQKHHALHHRGETDVRVAA